MALDFHTIHESALNPYASRSDVTMLWKNWGDMRYVYMLVQRAINKKTNRELCVTVPYKNNVGVYNSNGFGVFNLWYAYVIRKCFTTKYVYAYIMNK